MDSVRIEPDHHTDWSTASLAVVVGVMLLAALAVVLATAPFAKLLGPGVYALVAAMHGLAAFVYLVTTTIGLYLGWRLFMGRIKAFPDLQLLSAVNAALSLITIVFGNWLYIGYRAKADDSPRSWFMANMPEIHEIFFEFKEFAALFTLPLTFAAAYVLWHYGRQIIETKYLRQGVAIMMGLNFFYFSIAFGLGAAVTKLRAV